MSGISKKLMSASGGVGAVAIEDAFSTYLYTGNGSTQTITNGIDLAGEGGLVWTKSRGYTRNNNLVDTARGGGFNLSSNDTGGQYSLSVGVTSFNADGYQITDSFGDVNETALGPYASWTFRKAPRFFDVVTYTGDGVTSREIAHNLGVAPGNIIVKKTSSAGSWRNYHRTIGATGCLFLDLTNATDTSINHWNNTEPTESVFTVGINNNTSGSTFVAYLFAHDPLGPSGDGSDGLIACGSYTGNGSADGPEIDLGWEPQWLLVKSTTNGTAFWLLLDNMRGITTGGPDPYLSANTSAAEVTTSSFVSLTSRGFKVTTASGALNDSGGNYIYIAIRRGPMRAPESGTEVYLPSTATGVVTTGFPVDLHIGATRAGTSTNHRFHDRLRGGTKELVSSSTAAETTVTDLLFDGNEGLRFSFGSGQVNHFFRRAPEFFDVVTYTGDGVAGRTVPHNLGVAPELMIIKRRDGTSTWPVFSKAVFDISASGRLLLNENSERQNSSALFNSTAPTESVFTLGTDVDGNNSGSTYIAYLFATLAGVSKVGSYTGNGSSQTINCGFTTGARLVLIKATSTTGDWLIADTARGIVAGNDPYLELNTTNAEVTSEDWLDPDSSGFIVNEVAGSNANTSGVSYIFYAVA